MSELVNCPAWKIRLRRAFRDGYEPAPAEFIARQPYYPWVVVGTTCIATFNGQLDASIVQLMLPTLEHEFLARLSEVSWVAIAHQLAFTSILPVFARLATIAGRKLMFLTGFSLFTLASALCGMASDLVQLIAFRALLGAAGAMLGANSIAILVKAAGPGRQGRAMGIFAAAQAVGVSMGPVVGGVLLAALGWRWVFWITVPFALAGAGIGWMVIPQTTDLDPDRRFDRRGAMLLMPALTALLLTITESHAWGPTSPANRERAGGRGFAVDVHTAGAQDTFATSGPQLVPHHSLCRRDSRDRFVLRDAVRHVLSDVVRFGSRVSRIAIGGGAPARDHPCGARYRGAGERGAP